MRIIGGLLKGKKLITINNSNIRPTSGMVKESVFNILNNRFKKTNILDLFAGTGALGIEALSRGAKTAVFIDCDKKNVKNIKYNLMNLGCDSHANVLKWNILKNLNCLSINKNKFHIIFVDPPYNFNMLEPAILNLIKANVMTSETCIVVEHSIHEIILTKTLLTKLVLADQRKYGSTSISFLYPVRSLK